MTDFSSVFPNPGPLGKNGGKGEEGKEGYPFIIPDLWKPSCFAPDDSAKPTLFPIAPLKGSSSLPITIRTPIANWNLNRNRPGYYQTFRPL